VEVYPEESYVVAIMWTCTICEAICLTTTDGMPRKECECGNATWRLQNND
jgi:hypothetical protein